MGRRFQFLFERELYVLFIKMIRPGRPGITLIEITANLLLV